MTWGRAAAGPPRRVIIAMSLQPAIPRQVALQQSPPPLRRPPPVCVDPISETMKLQRTEKCPLFVCRRRGVQSRVSLAEYLRRLVAQDLGNPQRGTGPQAVFDLGASSGSDVAKYKAAMLAEAFASHRRKPRRRSA